MLKPEASSPEARVSVPPSAKTTVPESSAKVSGKPVVASIAVQMPVAANPSNAAALATGADTTENNPAVSADTATTAMRFLSVFVDICFLSSLFNIFELV
jgi:hypothetical protein